MMKHNLYMQLCDALVARGFKKVQRWNPREWETCTRSGKPIMLAHGLTYVFATDTFHLSMGWDSVFGYKTLNGPYFRQEIGV